jgi:conjugal transfer pilus assembly protein TraU
MIASIRFVKTLVQVLCLWLGFSFTALAGPTCHGKFPNPITDICWSCTLPLSIGNGTILRLGQEDTPNPGGLFCACSSPPRVGVKVGFWEPARIAEVTRTPYCMVALGGKEIPIGFKAPRGARPQSGIKTINGHVTQKQSFYQAHWYTNPIWFFLEVLSDSSCLEEGGFDIAYLTEVDPLWADDELTLILNPDAFLFANPIAQAACAIDCVAASTGFGRNELFWCAGCQGSMYPLNGHVGAHVGAVQASSLIMQRLTAKMHREFLMWSASGRDGLCSYYPQPLMDKTSYKSQMLYPVPNTKKIAGKCCQPYGRTTILTGSGKEFPVKGEDFAYQIFRKRNCGTGSENF